jgi:FKBP-type peptidyl-prolyl cis-trans isomerase FklB
MKITAVICACLFSCGLSAQKSVPKAIHAQEPPPKITKLNSAVDTFQYTLGVYMAQWVKNNGFAITNKEIFLKGMADVFVNREKLIPDSTVEPRITNAQRLVQKEIAFQKEKQLFTSLKDKPGLGVLPSGVCYMVINSGRGPYPNMNDTVVLNMIAKLVDGTVVENTYRARKPVIVTMTSLIPGLNEPLRMMPEGSRWDIYIPAKLAYAEKETALIPPHNALIITVELVQIKAVK